MILNKLARRHLKRLPTRVARDSQSEIPGNDSSRSSTGTFAGNSPDAHLEGSQNSSLVLWPQLPTYPKSLHHLAIASSASNLDDLCGGIAGS
nr:hypothetical protein Itr_chr04CG03600 [Ipomoea trifida]